MDEGVEGDVFGRRLGACTGGYWSLAPPGSGYPRLTVSTKQNNANYSVLELDSILLNPSHTYKAIALPCVLKLINVYLKTLRG